MLNFKDEIVIKDPCVEKGLVISNILSGEYTYTFCRDNPDGLGDIITKVRIYNTNYTNLDFEVTSVIGVDSGQCIISDKEFIETFGKGNQFYEKCCELSLKAVEDPEYKIFNEKFDHVNKDNVAEFSKYLKEHNYMIPFKHKYIRNCEEMNNKCLITSSGFGDGDYNIGIAKNKDGKIIGIEIIFVEDDVDN